MAGWHWTRPTATWSNDAQQFCHERGIVGLALQATVDVSRVMGWAGLTFSLALSHWVDVSCEDWEQVFITVSLPGEWEGGAADVMALEDEIEDQLSPDVASNTDLIVEVATRRP